MAASLEDTERAVVLEPGDSSLPGSFPPPSLREDLITRKPVIELTAGHLPPRGFGDTAGKVTGGHETSIFASSNVVISYLTKRISRGNLR